MSNDVIPIELLARTILVLRSQKVLLDADLARLYGVTTKGLNQAVKRNAARFPADFMFRVTAEESRSLRSQFVTLKREVGFHVRERAPHYRTRKYGR